jgi:hypothetical protein
MTIMVSAKQNPAYRPTSTPYTVGPTAPKIDIAFGTLGSLNCLNISGVQCNCSPYYVKSKITITD